MKITRKSVLSHKTTTREINVTEDELKRWENGELSQNVWPHLDPDDREFIQSGITPEEWEAVFG